MKRYGKILISTAIILSLLMAIYLCSMVVTARADTAKVGWNFIPFQTTAANPKTGWYHIYSGQMYDKSADVLAASPTWTNCVTAITVDATTGMYEDTPEATMPSGEYIWRLYDSASPAYTDEPIKSKLVYWSKELKQITSIANP